MPCEYTYRLCWPRLAWIRELRSLADPSSGRLIGVQILWRRSREVDDAF